MMERPLLLLFRFKSPLVSFAMFAVRWMQHVQPFRFHRSHYRRCLTYHLHGFPFP